MLKSVPGAGVIAGAILIAGLFGPSSVPTSVLKTPLDFGAVGDGVIDDTAAVQRAIDATQNGGALYFPGGFRFSVSKLTASGEIHWMGPGGSRLAGSPPSGAVIVQTNGSNTDLLTLNNAFDSSISGLAFDGNRFGQAQASNGIRMVNCEFTRLDNVYVTSCSGNGIVFENSTSTGTSDEIDLVDCYSVQNAMDGVHFDFVSPGGVGSPGDCEILGGHYDYNGGCGINLHVSSFTAISGANVLTNGQAGIEATFCTGLNIASNMVRNNTRQGILLGGGPQFTNCTDCSISGNEVQLNSRAGAGKYAEVDVGFGSTNTRLIGNYCGDLHAGLTYPANAKCGIWLHDGAKATILTGNACPAEDAPGGGLMSDSSSTYTATANVGIADTSTADPISTRLMATNGRVIDRLSKLGRETVWLGLTGGSGGTLYLPHPADLLPGASICSEGPGRRCGDKPDRR